MIILRYYNKDNINMIMLKYYNNKKNKIIFIFFENIIYIFIKK